jgi:uncharacterized protein YyaL (SSP411 family)
MANRLAGETSPYLQQHAGNPVDWYPWGPEALERARTEDKPILLSVGYSACHWCHVMAHESFEDPDIAEVMNRLFVNVKVDREERPDIDQIYQTAHQMLAQRGGGWPLTMFLAPDGTPFHGGTYYPKASRYGLPGFAELCERIAAVWRERRAEVDAQGEQVRIAFGRLESRLGRGGAHAADFDAAPIEELLANLREQFDEDYGGFGPAPKFPHATDLELCLRRYAAVGDGSALAMADLTLTRMCEGGIYDHLGGGFCRYSTDATWSIPHFEKMLYDNGPLLALLTDAWRITAKPMYAQVAAETAAWAMREMQSPLGGYYSSLDADSEGVEGRFYVWDREQVRKLLGVQAYGPFSAHYGLDGEPNFEEKSWHLRLGVDTGDLEAGPDIEAARAVLLAARELRVRPGRDDKILVSWNALMIRGMARAGRAFGREDWIDSARRAMDFIRTMMWKDGRLLATFRDGRAHLNAYLDDHAFLVEAALELLQAGFDPGLLAFAEELADAMLEQFEDGEHGGFWFTSHDHEHLLHRPKPGQDNSTPSGNGMAALALQRLAALTGEERYRKAAERAIELFYPTLRDFPAGLASLAMALEEALTPPATVILRGEPAAMADWSRALSREYWPSTLILAIAPGQAGLPPALDKPVDDSASSAVNAWVCQGVTCLAPIKDLGLLRRTCVQGVFR